MNLLKESLNKPTKKSQFYKESCGDVDGFHVGFKIDSVGRRDRESKQEN